MGIASVPKHTLNRIDQPPDIEIPITVQFFVLYFLGVEDSRYVDAQEIVQ